MTASNTRGSIRLGAVLVALCASGLLAACIATPPSTPPDPSIPVADESQPPVFSNLDDPPSTPGPSTPPVPTDDPGTVQLGDTVTVHTSHGSTWEVTVTGVIDDDNTMVTSYGNTIPEDERAVTIELKIENVGVITSHPYYDMMLGYQPEDGPMFDQNTGPSYGDYSTDLGYVSSIAPGETFTGHMSVYVPASAPEGNAVISPDGRKTFYVWE